MLCGNINSAAHPAKARKFVDFTSSNILHRHAVHELVGPVPVVFLDQSLEEATQLSNESFAAGQSLRTHKHDIWICVARQDRCSSFRPGPPPPSRIHTELATKAANQRD